MFSSLAFKSLYQCVLILFFFQILKKYMFSHGSQQTYLTVMKYEIRLHFTCQVGFKTFFSSFNITIFRANFVFFFLYSKVKIPHTATATATDPPPAN